MTWTEATPKGPEGFDHADQLVELSRARGDFKVGVGAFPDGHPASRGDFQADIEVLVRKEALGASFATTQFFFEIDDLLAFLALTLEQKPHQHQHEHHRDTRYRKGDTTKNSASTRAWNS